MIREDLPVKDKARNIHTHSKGKDEQVAGVVVRASTASNLGLTHRKAMAASIPRRLGGSDTGLANEATIAASRVKKSKQPPIPISIRGLRPILSIMSAPDQGSRLGVLCCPDQECETSLTHQVTSNAHCDPSTCVDELFFTVKPQSGVQDWAVVVDHYERSAQELDWSIGRH